jgi:lysophospholipase L1-like esterase
MSDGYGLIHLPVGARILVLGDDYVGRPETLPGAKLKSRKRDFKPGAPYTVELAKLLGPRVTVISQARPNARIEQTLADFASFPQADAIVILFGPGDAWGGPTPLPAQRFSSALRQLLEKAQAAGSAVVLVSPPPVSIPAPNTTVITAYRNVVGVQGGLAGASVIQFSPRFREVSHLWTDGIHLDAPGSRAVARNVAAQFVVPG